MVTKILAAVDGYKTYISLAVSTALGMWLTRYGIDMPPELKAGIEGAIGVGVALALAFLRSGSKKDAEKVSKAVAEEVVKAMKQYTPANHK